MIKKRVHWPKVKNVVWKVKIQCLPSWDTSADIPSMIKLPSQVPRSNWLAVYVFFFFFLNKTLKECITDLLSALYSVCVCVCVCVSRSVVSDSLWPHGLYSPLGSSIHGILQAWILEWVTIPFSRGSSWPRDQIWVSRVAGRVFTAWATRDALFVLTTYKTAENPVSPEQFFTVICDAVFQAIVPQFSLVQSLSRVRLFTTPWIAACQASLSITNSRSSLRLMSVESVMPSSHLILCRPLLLLPPIPPSIRIFPKESTLHMKWP